VAGDAPQPLTAGFFGLWVSANPFFGSSVTKSVTEEPKKALGVTLGPEKILGESVGGGR
jgi:hypothetical protein